MFVEYYGTLAHECAHATGHKSRLDRFAKFQDRKACALCLTTGDKRLITISEHYEIFGATD